MEHVESRPSKKKSKSTFEVYLEIKTTFTNLIAIVNSLKQNKYFPDVVILDNDAKKGKRFLVEKLIFDYIY